MLTSKKCEGYFEVFDIDNEVLIVRPTELGLTEKQEWRIFQAPKYTQQAAEFVQAGVVGGSGVARIHAHATCSLNGAQPQPYINSSINLISSDISSHVLWLPMHADL